MTTNKPFKTYRQQLTILRKRNLTIKDGSKAIKILRREGYYNIINGYKEIFIDANMSRQIGDDHYKSGASLQHIYSLYDFDRNLRTILIKYILKLETTLKVVIAYYFSNEFKQNFSYLDINNFDDTNPQKIMKVISKLSDVITNNSAQQEQGGQIFHYLNKYKELPLWVLIKKLTLGETYHLFEVLKPNMRQDIISDFVEHYRKEYDIPFQKLPIGISEHASFYNMLRFTNRIRNICAHDERLFNIIVKERNKIPKIVLFHVLRPTEFKAKIFDCIIILGLFLDKRDYKNLVKQISENIGALEKQLPQNYFNEVLIKMAFSRDWDEKILLP